MSAAAVDRAPARIGAGLAEGLIALGGMALMMLSTWPGLLKLAALLSLALGFIAADSWRRRGESTAGALWAGPAALAGAALTALLWPLAMPGERILTVGIVAGAAAVFTVAVLLALRTRPGGDR